MSNFCFCRNVFKKLSAAEIQETDEVFEGDDFLALLAKGQKGLCRSDLSVVRACVRKQFLVNTIQSSLLIVSQPNLYSS